MISEFQVALRWSQPAVRPEERRQRSYGDDGNGGGADPGGGDAPEEDIGPFVVLRGLAPIVNDKVASSTPRSLSWCNELVGKFVLVL